MQAAKTALLATEQTLNSTEGDLERELMRVTADAVRRVTEARSAQRDVARGVGEKQAAPKQGASGGGGGGAGGGGGKGRAKGYLSGMEAESGGGAALDAGYFKGLTSLLE